MTDVSRRSRSDRWRRTVAAGIVASVAVHVGVLAFLHLGGVVPGGQEEDRQARAEQGDRAWERQALRTVEVRERAPDGPEAAAAPSSRSAASAEASPASAGPAELTRIGQETAGSEVARAALSAMEDTATERTASRTRARREAAQPASVRPSSSDRARTVFRPANEAAREAARGGEAPDLGDASLVVDGSGRPSDWGYGDRGNGRRGDAFGGGSCSGGAGTIDRAIPDGLLVGR